MDSTAEYKTTKRLFRSYHWKRHKSNSFLSNYFSMPLWAVPTASITISITISRSTNFSALWQSSQLCVPFRFLLFLLCGLLKRQKFTRWQILFVSLIKITSGFLVEIWRSACIPKFPRISCVWFSRADTSFCLPCVCMIKFWSLAQFQEDHLSDPVVSTLVFLLRHVFTFVTLTCAEKKNE